MEQPFLNHHDELFHRWILDMNMIMDSGGQGMKGQNFKSALFNLPKTRIKTCVAKCDDFTVDDMHLHNTYIH